jgi:hypothetical protein
MSLTVKKITRPGEGRYHDSHGLYLQGLGEGQKVLGLSLQTQRC